VALKLWLQPRNGGLFPLDNEGEEALAAIGNRDVEVTIKADSIRSPDEHRLFFATIEQAFNSWKPDHEFRPENKEHLRAWLLCEAGYCTTTLFQVVHGASDGCFIESMDGEKIEVAKNIGDLAAKVAKAVRNDKRPIIDPYGPAVRVRIAKSIAWHNLGQARFHQIVSKVSDVLVAELGVSISDLKQIKEVA